MVKLTSLFLYCSVVTKLRFALWDEEITLEEEGGWLPHLLKSSYNISDHGVNVTLTVFFSQVNVTYLGSPWVIFIEVEAFPLLNCCSSCHKLQKVPLCAGNHLGAQVWPGYVPIWQCICSCNRVVVNLKQEIAVSDTYTQRLMVTYSN